MWGGRGGAKSISMADFEIASCNEEKLKFLNTRQVQVSIKDSVHSLIKGRILKNKISGFDINDKSIKNLETNSESIFRGLSTQTEESIKSLDDVNGCWVEEAQSITDQSLKILTPTIRAENSKLYYTYNRTEEEDPVHKLFNSHRTKKERMKFTDDKGEVYYWDLHTGDGCIGININWDGNPYFPTVLENERQQAKRTMSAADYLHVWEGEPEAQPGDAIIDIDEVVAAMKRKVDPVGAVELGVDVARSGKDRVVIAKRQGHKIFPMKVFKNLNKNEKMRCWQTAERAMQVCNYDKTVPIKVDDTGVGGGVTDELERKGYNVVPVNNQQKAVDENHYVNAISEMWFTFPHLLSKLDLPDDPELRKELTHRQKAKNDSQGRRCVEKKSDYVERCKKSPDNADAVLLCLYTPKQKSLGAEFGVNVY